MYIYIYIYIYIHMCVCILERGALPKTGFGEIQLEGESLLVLWINSWLFGLEISLSL